MALTLNFAIICEGNELETYDVKQEGPNSRAFVASRAGKVSISRIPSVSTRRLIVVISNSMSRMKTTCWTLTFRFTCIWMESALTEGIYNPGGMVKY